MTSHFHSLYSYRTPQKDKLWDSFQDPPPPQTGGSAVDTKRFESFKQILKLFTFIFVFVVILCAAVIAKSTFLLMATHTKEDSRVRYCNIRCKMMRRLMYCYSVAPCMNTTLIVHASSRAVVLLYQTGIQITFSY